MDEITSAIINLIKEISIGKNKKAANIESQQRTTRAINTRKNLINSRF